MLEGHVAIQAQSRKGVDFLEPRKISLEEGGAKLVNLGCNILKMTRIIFLWNRCCSLCLIVPVTDDTDMTQELTGLLEHRILCNSFVKDAAVLEDDFDVVQCFLHLVQ